uniref:Uncharacterized protein n=1 Tax=Peronospora matthiolae TaxID=2874970 RepID=A0AAV1TA76_9STRA
MWSPPPSSSLDAEQLFPRRPRRAIHSPIDPPLRRSSATSLLEQRRRDLPPFTSSTDDSCALNTLPTGSTSLSASAVAGPAITNANEFCSSPQGEKQEISMEHTRDTVPDNYGVIGSMTRDKTRARMFFSRPEREEEEREEEALPSYLSYLQAPIMAGESAAAVPTPVLPDLFAAQGQTHADQIQSTSQELARALQEFVLVQMQQRQGDGATSLTSSRPRCNCAWRVTELEKQVESLLSAQKEKTRSRAMDETGNTMGDRLSTLEGRQSAFQSQLAQIAKVLGVPVGKHGKNSQLKTLVQTLHEEIDAKVRTAVAGAEAALTVSSKSVGDEVLLAVAPAANVESFTPTVLDKEEEREPVGACNSIPQSGLPFSTVLNALAVEHEASLTRLNTHFDECLRLEGLERVALESRVQARFGKVEEWLQQVEGELGGSRFGSTSSCSIAATTNEMTRLQAHLTQLETSCNKQQLEVMELSAELKKLVHLNELGAQLDQQKDDVKVLREDIQTVASTTQKETQAVARTALGLKLIVEKLVRDTGSAEELLQQYVSTITHQVASVTRQYVSVRIRDNNRLIDATLRARVPDYVLNESESFLLVYPESKKKRAGCNLDCGTTQEPERNVGLSFGLREDISDRI